MKKLLIFLVIILKISLLHAQDFDTIPPYQKDSLHIPHFIVLKTDSTYANETVLPKDKPVVIVYFSPTCGHCQLTAQRFGEKMAEMKNIFFVWITYNHDLAEIQQFASKFNLQQFNNMLIGKLTDYSLPSYYRIKFTPFMAVYDKEHHLIKTYDQGAEADELIDLLKQSN